jgi:invasion protein IalB
VTLTPETIASLRSGTALKIMATADGGAATPFSVPLSGFSSAIDRAVALAAM